MPKQEVRLGVYYNRYVLMRQIHVMRLSPRFGFVVILSLGI